jgi:hypothetical protein
MEFHLACVYRKSHPAELINTTMNGSRESGSGATEHKLNDWPDAALRFLPAEPTSDPAACIVVEKAECCPLECRLDPYNLTV